MNVTFVSVNQYSGTTSVNFAGSNQNVVVWAISSSSTAPTYNGVTFTLLGQVSSIYGASEWLFYLPNPATGSNSFVPNSGATTVYVFANQNTASPYDTTSIVLSAATLINGITPTVNNGLILCGAANSSGSNAMSAGSGETQIKFWSTTISGIQTTSGAGVGVTTSWTPGSYSFAPYSTFAISLAPVSTSNALMFAGD